MLAIDVVKKAVKSRDNLDQIRTQVNEALASYYGGDALYDYVFPFSAHEEGQKLADRRKQTLRHYDNYPKEVTSIYIEGVYKSKQDTRITKDAKFDEFLSTVYKKWLLNDVNPFALILPELFIFFEQTPSTGDEASRAEEVDLLPESYVIFPHHVQNYQADEKGNILWASYWTGDKRKDLAIVTEEEVMILKDGKPGRYAKECNGKVLPSNPYRHEFQDEKEKPVCPFVLIQYAKNHFYGGSIGCAPLQDVVYKSIGNLQFISMFIEAAYSHLSLKLKMSRETMQNTTDEQSGIGNLTLIIEEGGPNNVPTGYIALPEMELSILIDIIYKYSPQGIFRAARLSTPSNIEGLSGIALLMYAVPQQNMLANISEFFQGYDEKITTMLKWGYSLAKARELKVSYPSQMDARAATDIMADVTAFVTNLSSGKIPYSNTYNVLILKKWYHAILPDITQEERTQGDKELEAWVETGETPKTVLGQLQSVKETAGDGTATDPLKDGQNKDKPVDPKTSAGSPEAAKGLAAPPPIGPNTPKA